MAKYFNVIVVCEFDNCGRKENQFLKYRNVPPAKLRSFWNFVRQIPDLHHVNFYDKDKPKGKNFVKQVGAQDILNGTASI